jgi:hypothetical protein
MNRQARSDQPRLDMASSDAHFEQILQLQRRYHTASLSDAEQQAEGFLFVEHTVPILKAMANALPQAIALVDDRVVGYCLSMPLSFETALPSLQPMFEQFQRCTFRGRPLPAYRFFVGGQVCVDRAYRGQGLLARLYRQVRSSVSGYELCVTEISSRNQVSVRAHQAMGFVPLHTYSADREDWSIVAWSL